MLPPSSPCSRSQRDRSIAVQHLGPLRTITALHLRAAVPRPRQALPELVIISSARPRRTRSHPPTASTPSLPAPLCLLCSALPVCSVHRAARLPRTPTNTTPPTHHHPPPSKVAAPPVACSSPPPSHVPGPVACPPSEPAHCPSASAAVPTHPRPPNTPVPLPYRTSARDWAHALERQKPRHRAIIGLAQPFPTQKSPISSAAAAAAARPSHAHRSRTARPLLVPVQRLSYTCKVVDNHPPVCPPTASSSSRLPPRLPPQLPPFRSPTHAARRCPPAPLPLSPPSCRASTSSRSASRFRGRARQSPACACACPTLVGPTRQKKRGPGHCDVSKLFYPPEQPFAPTTTISRPGLLCVCVLRPRLR